jgi:hypothetical protein
MSMVQLGGDSLRQNMRQKPSLREWTIPIASAYAPFMDHVQSAYADHVAQMRLVLLTTAMSQQHTTLVTNEYTAMSCHDHMPNIKIT